MPMPLAPLPLPSLLAASALALLLGAEGAAAAGSQPTSYRGSKLVASPATGWCAEMRGPAGGLGLEGAKLLLQSRRGTLDGVEFEFASGRRQQALLAPPDPTAGFSALVRGSGDPGHRSAFVTLDPALWKPIGKGSTPKGWRYVDKSGSRGGIRYARLGRSGRLSLRAAGAAFGFVPDGSDDEVWVDVYVGNTRYCAQFGGDSVQRNEDGLFKARGSEGPAACPEPVCGNAVQEVGEACDDGDLDPADGCANDCSSAACVGDPFDSTFEAIQQVVLDGYGCASGFCHGASDHPSGLTLLPGTEPGALDHNYEALLGASPANQLGYDKFVVEGDSKTSLLYQVLWKQTNCGGAADPDECAVLEGEGVQSMPVGGELSAAQLEAIDLWIRGGAPKDLVVAGTADKLDACLPPADPLKIDPPPAPGAGQGVQLVSSAWDLPKQSENEICFPIYYDFTQTALIPEDQQFDCPRDFGPLNTGGKCFRWHEQLLLQDPQSHHSIIHIYTGQYGVDHEAWGPWTTR
jgi:cysteine-rich repeat protein